MMMKYIIMLVVAATSFAAPAVSKIRLVYGDNWDRAGQAIAKTLASNEFKNKSQGKYTVETIVENERSPKENLGSLKLPAIFLIDEKGRCYCVLENVPYNVSAEHLLATAKKVDKRREAIEKEGMDTAEQCGKLMFAMERYVGGPKRVIGKAYYGDVFERLKKLDPNDETGWQRHFTMDDGLSIVEKATEYRNRGDLSDGEKFIESEIKKPSKHLTLEQKQSLLMARFALYRNDPERKAEMKALLTRIAEAGEETFWGTAALGWLNLNGAAPLSYYWGWHNGDFAPPRFSTTVKYGISYAFRRVGEYTIELIPDNGGVINVESITLMAGNEEVVTIKKVPYTYKLPRSLEGRITSMVIKGAAVSDTTGKFKIERKVLRPRKAQK